MTRDPVEASDRADEGVDVDRRDMGATLLGALGLLAVGACVTGDDGAPAEALAEAAATGTAFRWVDTQANLRALATAGIADLSVAVLGGYAAANDGGGGIFIWRASSTAVDDGGTVVRPNAIAAGSPGRWVRSYSGAVNVRWYGAGLGAGDDAPRIQAAIEAAILKNPGGASYGSTVYLPSGTYQLLQPVYIETSDPTYAGWISVRICGDGKFNTHVSASGPYHTAFVFGGLSQAANPNGPAERLRHCEISSLSITQTGTKTQFDGSIVFAGGGIGYLIRDVSMYGVWRGITCSSSWYTWRAKLQNVHMEGVQSAGIYARFALNWDVSNTYIGGANHTLDTTGIWLDTRTEGWMFTILETGGFDSGLRMTNTSQIPGHTRPPDTHQFVQCNFDAGGRACIWLTASHRCRFQGCYASSAESTLTGVIVLDGADIYGLEWADSVILNAHNHCFWISNATNFAVTGSTFATWGRAGGGPWDAFLITGAATTGSRLSFQIIGNTFHNDPDFPSGSLLWSVRVPSGLYAKYIVTNNLSYGANMLGYANNGTGPNVFSSNI